MAFDKQFDASAAHFERFAGLPVKQTARNPGERFLQRVARCAYVAVRDCISVPPGKGTTATVVECWCAPYRIGKAVGLKAWRTP